MKSSWPQEDFASSFLFVWGGGGGERGGPAGTQFFRAEEHLHLVQVAEDWRWSVDSFLTYFPFPPPPPPPPPFFFSFFYSHVNHAHVTVVEIFFTFKLHDCRSLYVCVFRLFFSPFPPISFFFLPPLPNFLKLFFNCTSTIILPVGGQKNYLLNTHTC